MANPKTVHIRKGPVIVIRERLLQIIDNTALKLVYLLCTIYPGTYIGVRVIKSGAITS